MSRENTKFFVPSRSTIPGAIPSRAWRRSVPSSGRLAAGRIAQDFSPATRSAGAQRLTAAPVNSVLRTVGRRPISAGLQSGAQAPDDGRRKIAQGGAWIAVGREAGSGSGEAGLHSGHAPNPWRPVRVSGTRGNPPRPVQRAWRCLPRLSHTETVLEQNEGYRGRRGQIPYLITRDSRRSGWRDLNSRHLVPKTSTLPLSYTPIRQLSKIICYAGSIVKE